jgi:hypothetical protein
LSIDFKEPLRGYKQDDKGEVAHDFPLVVHGGLHDAVRVRATVAPDGGVDLDAVEGEEW